LQVQLFRPISRWRRFESKKRKEKKRKPKEEMKREEIYSFTGDHLRANQPSPTAMASMYRADS
jgi:hypothetical protein